MSITIYGASDDLIEVTGDIHEEFNVWLENDETILLALGIQVVEEMDSEQLAEFHVYLLEDLIKDVS